MKGLNNTTHVRNSPEISNVFFDSLSKNFSKKNKCTIKAEIEKLVDIVYKSSLIKNGKKLKTIIEIINDNDFLDIFSLINPKMNIAIEEKTICDRINNWREIFSEKSSLNTKYGNAYPGILPAYGGLWSSKEYIPFFINWFEGSISSLKSFDINTIPFSLSGDWFWICKKKKYKTISLTNKIIGIHIYDFLDLIIFFRTIGFIYVSN